MFRGPLAGFGRAGGALARPIGGVGPICGGSARDAPVENIWCGVKGEFGFAGYSGV